MSVLRQARAISVAALFMLATARCGTPPTVDPAVPDPVAASTTVPVTDPPFVADAAGVPTATPPVIVAVDTPPVPVVVVPGPSGTAITGRCTQYEDLLTQLAPPAGWSVDRLSVYMWRESRCTPWARSKTRDSGLLQINDVNLRYLRTVLGEWVDRSTLLDPVQNVRAAAALCTYWQHAGRSCYRPWGGR